MGIFGAAKRGLGMLGRMGKKKSIPKVSKPEPKTGSKEWFDKQDPFVRNKVLSVRASAKRGDVHDAGGNVVATPHKERSAKTIMKRHPGSYQLHPRGGKK